LLAVLWLTTSPAPAGAQDAPDLAEAAAPADEGVAEELYRLRLGHREARMNEGWTLVAFGGVSLAAGGILTGVGAAQNDERLLWAGLGTLGWGAINAVFSLFLMDLSGEVRRDIDEDRHARGADLTAAREDAAREQWRTAATIAVNAGLDVFYVATGILLAVLGDLSSPGEWSYAAREGLVGYGAAMAAQGGVLLVYDVVTWLLAQDRGDRTMALGR
jgi:hypothetical protein